MPGYLDDLEDEDEGESQSDVSGPDKGETDAGGDPKASDDKRIRDLQSARDKETARANKAEKQLKALLSAGDGADPEGGKPPATDAGGNVTEAAVLDMARMFVFQQHPKLADYGISASDLNGSTPAEVANRAVELEAHYEKVETRIKNRVLAEQGLAPEIDEGAPAPKRDFSKMSKEDFQKVMDEAMGKTR